MAEGLVRLRLAATGAASQVVVSSAGTWATNGQPATPNAVTTLRERGGDISGHRSRDVTLDMVAEADLVLVMTSGHLEAITAEFPAARDKTILLSQLAGGRWDIDDPVGQPLAAYRATADELDRLIAAGWARLVAQAAEHA
jgi:protein-tyrosine-phosphatase